jgi:hypothetical protein
VEPRPRSHEDDLTEVKGIGPRTAAKLEQAGIRTYDELADATPDQLAAIAGVSRERVDENDWVGQARALANPPVVGSVDDARPPGRHNFTVELRLDPTDDTVLTTTIHHVRPRHQGSEPDPHESWPGWDGDRLLSFIQSRAMAETTPADELAAGRRESVVENTMEAPRALARKEVYPPEDSICGGYSEIHAAQLLLPGSGPTLAILRLGVTHPEAEGLSATGVYVEVYGQRPPAGRSYLLGRASATLGGEPPVIVEVELADPASDHPLEVFAVVTFVRGDDLFAGPTGDKLANAELILRTRSV